VVLYATRALEEDFQCPLFLFSKNWHNAKMPSDLNRPYEPKGVEEEIYKKWENSGYFNPDNLPVSKTKNSKLKTKNFSIIMPPPNANGALHIGHAVFVTLQDIMIRYNRMLGKKTLWLPGADHAGFETQVVFDKKLEKEGRSRFKIGREDLWQEIWDFTILNKKIMEGQLKRLGASCDWSREKFTLDPDIIEIVYDTFKKLYDDGLAYRDNRIVNWCTKHQTTLSDVEIKYVEKKDPLYYIKYGPIELATVRLETKFGDTAVAVNPKDKRYKNFVGKEIKIQTILGPAKIKVIADEAVDIKFGTGAVKVTPAHDPNDFEMWKRHKEEIPGPKTVIDQYGRMDLREFWEKERAKKYHGLKIAEARNLIAQDMQKEGLMAKIDNDYTHTVATCYKCGTILEPRILPQWFISMTKPPAKGKKSLRDLGVETVKKGEVKFIPQRMEKIYMHWMKNLRDWNISRQIVWGIRIPAWYCRPKTFEKIMGFYTGVVPEVAKGKTKTYRIRDHQFKQGDIVGFENSQTKEIFGQAKIIKIEKIPLSQINLKDPGHYKTYESHEELIEAIKKHQPQKEVNENTEVIVYSYEFSKLDKKDSGCGNVIVSTKTPEKCPRCGSKNLEQDSDVFDTWFSSGQWPFAALGYTDSKDFKTFYPTDVMETGWDILFFWVARMVMLGKYRTGKAPFKTVYLHGLVRDKDRQKMSKSKGNVIDPLGVADLYGADALRMALVIGNTAGNDIIISEEKVKGYRNFANKIWNATRFVLMNVKETPAKKISFTPEQKKALQKLDEITRKTAKDLDELKFHHAAENLYHFFWHYYADKVIEDTKKDLNSGDKNISESTKALLLKFHTTLLKLLHPFMPHITEKIWELIPRENKKMLIIEEWPKSSRK